jgi:hypothetical protein
VPKATDPALVELAKALYIQGVRPHIIATETGLKLATLKTLANRHKWNHSVANAQAVRESRAQKMMMVAVSQAEKPASVRLREALSAELEQQVKALQAEPVTRANQLANSPLRQGRAAVLQTIANTAKLVHDWGTERPGGVVLCDLLSEEPAAIDVESPPCGPEPTTCSVQVQEVSPPETLEP